MSVLPQIRAEKILMYHKYLYYEKGDPILSDFKYDELEKRFRKEFPESNLINYTIECPRRFYVEFERRYWSYKEFQAQIKQDRLSEPSYTDSKSSYGFMNPFKPLISTKDKVRTYLKQFNG